MKQNDKEITHCARNDSKEKNYMNSIEDRFTHPTFSEDNSTFTQSPFVSGAETLAPSCRMKSFIPASEGEFFISAEEDRITAEFLFAISSYLLFEMAKVMVEKVKHIIPSQNQNCLLIVFFDIINTPRKKRKRIKQTMLLIPHVFSECMLLKLSNHSSRKSFGEGSILSSVF